jgi:hypothetical protein
MSPGTLMSTGLIAGGSLAGIIVAFLILLPDLKAKLDFAAQPAGGESFKLSAWAAFSVMVAVLLAVALIGKRPISAAPEAGDKALLGEIGESERFD